jgi:asparagine synthase (glutamine-hydrolysing)
MCGICGVVNHHHNDLPLKLEQMVKSLHHRGPDDRGHTVLSNNQVGLGHTRLAIVDLSKEGHQPMVSQTGRYHIVFNGEIYNFKPLKQDLQLNGYAVWHGDSDTEVILALIETHGFIKTLDYLNGMFAIACFDTHTKKLYLARDRMGEKPLYYGHINQSFVFASELKALAAYAVSPLKINPTAIAQYLQFSYVPAPLSIYKDIFKLLPGHYLEIDIGNTVSTSKQIPYWQQNHQPLMIGYEEAKHELKSTLHTVIQEHMIADRPLGAFLSGGIDSSTVVALMQAQSEIPINTFSIGFEEQGFSEAPYAKAVAEHLACKHHQKILSSQQAFDILERMPEVYDEPFADSSQIPTYLVSQYAKDYVTVALSGDGADELFGGYTRYLWTQKIWRKIGWMPMVMRKAITTILNKLPESSLTKLVNILPARLRFSHPKTKIDKLCKILKHQTGFDIYKELVSTFNQPNAWFLSPDVDQDTRFDALWQDEQGFVEGMMLLDSQTYLPDDIMVKVDRAAMAHSLETRAPFLDRRVVEVANKIPLEFKINQDEGKHILKEILYQYVPKSLFERPKMGFAIPLNQWLRGPLKSWLEHLLYDEAQPLYQYLNKTKIQHHFQTFLNLQHDGGDQIWNIAMLFAWANRWQKPNGFNYSHEFINQVELA